MLLGRTVYSLTREKNLAGCELYIQTFTFLVLTLKQHVNAKTIWGSKVRNINRRDDFCQPLTTYAASIQLTLEVFPGKRIVLEPSLHFNPGLQSSVCILPSVYILPPVCSLRFTLTALLWFSRLDHQLTDSCLCFAHLMAASRLHPIPLILITIFKLLSSNDDHQKTNFLSY